MRLPTGTGVYGNTGFVQWQCVIPDSATPSLYELVDRLGRLPSFFTVLKRFGPGNQSPLSFPAPGWTVAVDLPATAKALNGLGALDRIVADAGGRIYLAKDARMERELFEQMYPRRAEFSAVRASVDPEAPLLFGPQPAPRSLTAIRASAPSQVRNNHAWTPET